MRENEKNYIVIPSYQPGDELVGLVEMILGYGRGHFRILVVDDGSGRQCKTIFDHLSRNLRVTLLTHSENRGKGAALKTAFNYLLQRNVAQSVVTADADGQHKPFDISRVVEAANKNPGRLILGCRSFKNAENVPLRSRFGNYWSVKIFKLFTGTAISDIQTGLRGIPAAYLPLLVKFPQDRFDFESAMLLDNAVHRRFPFHELQIESVYMENHTSHFRPFRDTMRIIRTLKEIS